jgi:hypothetical protein
VGLGFERFAGVATDHDGRKIWAGVGSDFCNHLHPVVARSQIVIADDEFYVLRPILALLAKPCVGLLC